jgi:hypothetical protein
MLIAAIAFPCFGFTCGPGPEPPEPDSCGAPLEGQVTSLEIGPERIAGRGFEAWTATDSAYVTTGPQGGDMLGIALQISGAEPPECLAQASELRQGEVLATSQVAVTTYPEAEGVRATETLWLVFAGGSPAVGSQIEVSAEAAGLTASRSLTVVADRHRLLSLTPGVTVAQPGDYVTFTLETQHVPEWGTIPISVSSSDPSVLAPTGGTDTSYDPLETLTAQAWQAGSAELIVTYKDQELRAAITVE